MKLNTMVEKIIHALTVRSYHPGDIKLRGYLASSDPRFERFRKPHSGDSYEHTAMPLLDLSLDYPLVFMLDLQTGNLAATVRRALLHHDSIWLMEISSAMREAIKIPYAEILALEIREPTEEEKSRSDVSEFLDKL